MEEIIESFSPGDTYELGVKLGKNAVPGLCIALKGDLGAGKTLFTQGLAKGLGIEDCVNSPTFTILQVYEDGRLPLYHMDAYRIEDVDELSEIGFMDYLYGEGVMVIEWAELIEEVLPDNLCHINIERDMNRNMDFRRIIISRP